MNLDIIIMGKNPKTEVNDEVEIVADNTRGIPKDNNKLSQDCYRWEESNDVVEIFADNIRDISDDDTELSQDCYRWEEDEWYRNRIVNVKQEEISYNPQSNCEPTNNEDLKPAIVNETEKSNKALIEDTSPNEMVEGVQLRESDDDNSYGNDKLDLFSESYDFNYIPEGEKESNGQSIVHKDQLSCNTSDGYANASGDQNFGKIITKKQRKRKRHIDGKNDMGGSDLKQHCDKKGVPVKPIKTCPFCSFKTNSGQLKLHIRRIHSGNRIKCEECPFSCKNERYMRKHVYWHRNEAPLKCGWCSFSHRRVSTMTWHERFHSTEDRSRCRICQATFSYPYELKEHMSRHKTSDQFTGPVFCANCPYKAKRKRATFVRHVLGHLKKDGIKCDYCTFRHDLPHVLTVHTKLHVKEEVNGDREKTSS